MNCDNRTGKNHDTLHYSDCSNAERRRSELCDAECYWLSVAMPSVGMLNAKMLSVDILRVVIIYAECHYSE